MRLKSPHDGTFHYKPIVDLCLGHLILADPFLLSLPSFLAFLFFAQEKEHVDLVGPLEEVYKDHLPVLHILQPLLFGQLAEFVPEFIDLLRYVAH